MFHPRASLIRKVLFKYDRGQPLNMFVCLIWSVPPDLLHASLNSPPCVVTPVSLAHSPYAQHTLFKLSGPADPRLTPPLADYYLLETRSD